MPRAINRCPNCGSPVTPFAAGCAICGEDLEAARARLATRRRIELPRRQWYSPRWGASGGSVDWLHILVAVVVALAIAPLGLLLAVYWGWQRYQAGNMVMAAAMAGVGALAIAAMLAPVWFWSHLL